MKKNAIKKSVWGVLFFVCVMQGGRQQITVYNETMQSIFITFDCLPYEPLRRSIITQGHSKNFFVSGLDGLDRIFYFIVDSTEGQREFTVEYRRKQGVILLKRGTFVIDSVPRTVIDPTLDIKIGVTKFLDVYFMPTGRCISKKTAPCFA